MGAGFHFSARVWIVLVRRRGGWQMRVFALRGELFRGQRAPGVYESRENLERMRRTRRRRRRRRRRERDERLRTS